MSRGVNKVILIGNLGSDPEVKYLPSGVPLAKFNLATSESWTNKNGERQEKTEWHRLVVWSKLAEIAGKYLKKGSKVYVEGRLETRSWDDAASGQKRYMTEIVVTDMKMLDGRGEPAADKEIPGSEPGPIEPDSPGRQDSGGNGEDDLPF